MRSGRTAGQSPWLALAALCLGFSLMLLDSTIVAVAIPVIATELGETSGATVWVNSGYLFAYAVPLLFAGRWGDRLGARRVYLIGLVVFVVASLACGLSPTLLALTVARVAQGFGAALMTPQTLAIIRRVFPPRTRPIALGVWGGVGGVAAAAGPLLGGVLVQLAGWESIFLVNVPLGVIALALAILWVPAVPTSPAQIPAATAIASAAGVFAVIVAVHEATALPVGAVIALAAIGIALLVVAFAVQPRDPERALVPLPLVRDRTFALATAAATCASFVVGSALVPIMLFLQDELGYAVGTATLAVLPLGVVSALTAPLAGLTVQRFGSRPVAIAGTIALALSTAGAALAAQTGQNGLWIGAAMAVFGFANSFVWSPLASAAMTAAPVELAGSASGTYNATRQVGAVLGSALVAAAIAGTGNASALWLLAIAGVVAVAAAIALPRDTGRPREVSA